MKPRTLTRTERFVRDIPTLPSWWTLFQVVAAGLLGAVLLVSLLGSGPTAGEQAARPPAPPPATPAATAPPSDRPTATPSQPTGGDDTEPMTVAGKTVRVPIAAVTVAEAAAVAQFTGDYTSVPTDGTASSPVVAYPAAELLSLDLRTANPGGYTFDARMSLNPADPSQTAVVPVTVRQLDGQWWYVPDQR